MLIDPLASAAWQDAREQDPDLGDQYDTVIRRLETNGRDVTAGDVPLQVIEVWFTPVTVVGREQDYAVLWRDPDGELDVVYIGPWVTGRFAGI